MSPGIRLHGTFWCWGAASAKFLTMLLSDGCFLISQIYSLQLGLPLHAPLYCGRRPLPVLYPPASAMSHVPARHALGRSLPGPACKDQDLSPRMRLVVFQCF
jgi:hypothetical protein